MLRKRSAPASTSRSALSFARERSSDVDRPLTPATAGIVLLDAQNRMVYHNAEAANILVFPGLDRRTNGALLDVLPRELQAVLLTSEPRRRTASSAAEFRSGKRRYRGRIFVLARSGKPAQATTAIVLERSTPNSRDLSAVARYFRLTLREQQTVELLTLGLTSKEIASRMNISPNTVKAFFRMVMTKMAVSTRAGIVGKIALMGPSD